MVQNGTNCSIQVLLLRQSCVVPLSVSSHPFGHKHLLFQICCKTIDAHSGGSPPHYHSFVLPLFLSVCVCFFFLSKPLLTAVLQAAVLVKIV